MDDTLWILIYVLLSSFSDTIILCIRVRRKKKLFSRKDPAWEWDDMEMFPYTDWYTKWSSREEFIKKNWSHELETLTHEDVRKTLSPLAYHVTQEGGTEPPFENPYWNTHRKGIYVDTVDGTQLFSSLDKFDSGTGWSSFTRSIDPKNVSFRENTSLFLRRIEVRSKNADSHLGHVFDDGPKDLWWKRYCMNSAALRFIPYEELEREGYGAWKYISSQKMTCSMKSYTKGERLIP